MYWSLQVKLKFVANTVYSVTRLPKGRTKRKKKRKIQIFGNSSPSITSTFCMNPTISDISISYHVQTVLLRKFHVLVLENNNSK